MNYLQKPWVRIVLSLLAGGLITELIHISTGDPNRASSAADSYLVLIIAFVCYFILTSIFNRNK